MSDERSLRRMARYAGEEKWIDYGAETHVRAAQLHALTQRQCPADGVRIVETCDFERPNAVFLHEVKMPSTPIVTPLRLGVDDEAA